MSIFAKIFTRAARRTPGLQDLTLRELRGAKVAALLSASALLLGTACKEVKPEPKATATTTPNLGSTTTSTISTTPVPTPQVDPRCAQTQAFACNVAADLVELCKTKETDTAQCTQPVWPKALFDKMVAIQSGKDLPLEACKADPLFVATDNDPLNLREKPDESATIITEVPRREAVKCLGLTGFWAKVKTDDGKEGFMKAEYLSSAKPAANTTGGNGGNNNNNNGASTASPKPSAAPAPAGTTIECSRWLFQETKTESTFAGSTCDDKNNDTWSLFGAKNKWLNCVKVGDILGVWQCKCDRYQEEIKWMTLAECKSPWAPRN